MAITDYLSPDAVALQIDAVDSADVIRRLGGRLLDLGCVRDDFIEATLAREASMPTGLPDVNAAIPHVDPEYVIKPSVALATLVKPIFFKHMVENDVDVPVQLVFMLALTSKEQVDLLQQVVEVIQQPAARDRLMAARTPDEAFATLSAFERA